MLDSIGAFLRTAISEQVLGDPVWAGVALVGQTVFAGRFVVQWIASERRQRSFVPLAFWWMSIAGSLLMLAYALHLRNLILMMAFSLNMLIYLRNIHLIYRRGTGDAESPSSRSGGL